MQNICSALHAHMFEDLFVVQRFQEQAGFLFPVRHSKAASTLFSIFWFLRYLGWKFALSACLLILHSKCWATINASFSCCSAVAWAGTCVSNRLVTEMFAAEGFEKLAPFSFSFQLSRDVRSWRILRPKVSLKARLICEKLISFWAITQFSGNYGIGFRHCLIQSYRQWRFEKLLPTWMTMP